MKRFKDLIKDNLQEWNSSNMVVPGYNLPSVEDSTVAGFNIENPGVLDQINGFIQSRLSEKQWLHPVRGLSNTRAKLNLIGLDFPCTGKEAVRDGTVAEYPVTQFGGRYGWDSTIGEVVQDDGIAHRLGYSLKLVAEFTKAANGLYEIDMKIVPDVPETVQVGESLDEAVNVVAKFKSDAAGAAAVGSETSRTGLLDGGKKVKDGEYSLTFKNDRMKDKFMKKYDSKLAESVQLDEMQPHGMFGGQDDLGPVYRMIRSALDKIGIGYRISGQTVKVNPKNVGAAKAALKKAKGFDKSGMSVVKDNKVAFAEAYKPVKDNMSDVRITLNDKQVEDVKDFIMNSQEYNDGDIEEVDTDGVDGGGMEFKGTGDIFIYGQGAGSLGSSIQKKFRNKVKVMGESTISELSPEEQKLLDFINKNW